MRKKRDALICNLHGIDKMETYDPKNREVAFAFQIHDSVGVLYATAHASPESFERQLQIIETYIANYRGIKL